MVLGARGHTFQRAVAIVEAIMAEHALVGDYVHRPLAALSFVTQRIVVKLADVLGTWVQAWNRAVTTSRVLARLFCRHDRLCSLDVMSLLNRLVALVGARYALRLVDRSHHPLEIPVSLEVSIQ